MELPRNERGSDLMSSAHAPVPGHDETDLSEEFGGWADESPILLADIDQILEESAHVERARASDPIRAWRDDLKVALDSLAYARGVLAADVGILRHCLGRAPPAGGGRRPPLGHDDPVVGRRVVGPGRGGARPGDGWTGRSSSVRTGSWRPTRRWRTPISPLVKR